MSDNEATTESRPRFWKNEDWLAVIAAAILIGVMLLGWRPGMPKLGTKSLADFSNLFSGKNLQSLGMVFLAIAPLAAAAAVAMGAKLLRFLAGFAIIFILGAVSIALADYAPIKAWGFEYVIFALLIGLTLSHLGLVPGWLRQAILTEFYVKTGLVLLGATILFKEILQAGALGIVQSLLVVFVVWQVAFFIARKLKVDDEFSVMLSSAVAICGVSAAIAACGAIQGDKKKLSYVTSLVLVCAAPMMILMPWIVKVLNIPDLVGGAWMGGTLDTTASVAAAAQQISDPAMKLGTIVKFSQNVLLGGAAFVISVWWTMRPAADGSRAERPGFGVIWERFPKFVLGFLIASLIFSFVVDPAQTKEVKPLFSGLRNFWFALAFVSIGLETRVTDLLRMHNGRPALAFVLAQLFNVVWTLALAWVFFSGKFFPVPSMQ